MVRQVELAQADGIDKRPSLVHRAATDAAYRLDREGSVLRGVCDAAREALRRQQQLAGRVEESGRIGSRDQSRGGMQ